MKPIKKQQGIILKAKEFKESSSLINVLTSDGLITMVLRGTTSLTSGNKKYTIVPVKVDFLRTDTMAMPTFTEGEIVENYTNLKNDSHKTLITTAIIEKILTFAEHIDDKVLFYDFVGQIFNLLNTYQESMIILNIFEVKLLYLLGLAPNLLICCNCQKKAKKLYFSLNLGGVICENCAHILNYDLDTNATMVFKYLYLIKLNQINDEFFQIINNIGVDLNDFIDLYYEKYIDFKSVSKKIIKKLLKGELK